MKKRIIILLIAILLLCGIAAAEVLTLEQAQHLAKANNPQLQAAESEMLSAKKSMQSSYFNLGPSASLSYSRMYMNPGMEQISGSVRDETSSIGITATQPLLNGGRILLGAQMADNGYKMKEAAYRAKLLEIITETESKYYAVQSNVELVKALEKTHEQSTMNLETAEAKLESGLLSRAEYLQMESEQLSSELDLINMRNALELSRLDLADHTGYAGKIEVADFDLSEYEDLLQKLQVMKSEAQSRLTGQLVALGKRANPGLQISTLGISTAKKSKLLAAGNFLPSLNLSYSYDWQASNLDKDYEGSSSVVLAASLPIFPLADNALDYQAAHYDLISSERSHKSTENSITLAIRSACLNLYSSARAVKSAGVSNEAAWESWYQMRERFEQGLISASELLSAEVMVISSDTNNVRTRQEFLKALSSLRQLTGIEDKAEFLEIIYKAEEK